MATDRIDDERRPRTKVIRDTRGTSTAQAAARVAGMVLLLIGVLGFIPGITQNYDDLELAGNTSDAELLGVFQVSVLLNVIHIALGIAGLVLAKTLAGARRYLIGGGLVALALWLLGVLTTQLSDANFLPVNVEDDYLHVVVGVLMLLLAFLPSRRVETGTVRADDRVGSRAR